MDRTTKPAAAEPRAKVRTADGWPRWTDTRVSLGPKAEPIHAAEFAALPTAEAEVDRAARQGSVRARRF